MTEEKAKIRPLRPLEKIFRWSAQKLPWMFSVSLTMVGFLLGHIVAWQLHARPNIVDVPTVAELATHSQLSFQDAALELTINSLCGFSIRDGQGTVIEAETITTPPFLARVKDVSLTYYEVKGRFEPDTLEIRYYGNYAYACDSVWFIETERRQQVQTSLTPGYFHMNANMGAAFLMIIGAIIGLIIGLLVDEQIGLWLRRSTPAQ